MSPVFNWIPTKVLKTIPVKMQPFYDPSTTAAAAASSSTSTPNGGSSRRYSYKVFLSFRGEDTRLNFVSHLYKELTQKGIHTFKDDHDLKRGDSLTPSLLEAISGSRVAVVVLSEHHASSTWCLKELVEIMECRKRNGLLVIPIFYKVDPSDVKNQSGSFGEDMEKHEKERKRDQNDYGAEMEKWRNALTQVATIAGWDSRGRDEAIFIESIVRDISDKLACATSLDACDLVAIGSQIAKFDKLLEVEREVHMLGIWGMGGIGKTTLAKVLYDKMSPQYQACCFLGNVKDKFEKFGAIGLQKELLSKVLLERDSNIWFLDENFSIIKDRLCCKKVLIVLDDVDDIKQLKVLAKHHNWFGLGSTIIITTRDKRLLDQHEVDAIHQVKLLKNDEALQLFSRHAFKQNQIEKDYWGLAVDFVNYAKGLPLALQVLGCFLHDRPINFWKDELQKLRNTPNPSISDVLKVSYVGLEDNEKEVFLDIACFHNGIEKDKVRFLLNGCRLFPDRAFPILIEKSLIYIERDFFIGGDVVCMHKLLQDMGRNIVRCESNKPGERSRLWDLRDIRYVLTKKKGTEMIKGISLKLYQTEDKMDLEEDAFVKMDCLRFLQVFDTEHKVHIQDRLHRGLQFSTDELAYFCWQGYPVKNLSLEFCAQNLVELDLTWSKVETLWEGALEFVNLKVLKLQSSRYLVRTPDLSKAQNIKEIDLSYCESLIEVHPSIEFLGKLEMWNMWGCKNLSQLPNRLGNLKSLNDLYLAGTAITELPSSIKFLSRLTLLEMKCCKYLCQLPNWLGNFESLEYLSFGEMAITQFPSFIEFLSRLKRLEIINCLCLSKLPNWLSNFTSLEELSLEQAAITELPQSIDNLTLLRELNLFCCEKLESLPINLYRLSSLWTITVNCCKRLRFIPKLPPLLIRLQADFCESLENFAYNSIGGGIQAEFSWFFYFKGCFKLNEKARNNIFSFALSIFQKYSHEEVQFWLPGSELPTWICNQSMGSAINVQTPFNFTTIGSVSCCVVVNCEDYIQEQFGPFYLGYRCQFKGDSRNQGHIEDQSIFIYDLDDICSLDHMILCNFKKSEALGCAVGGELSFEFFIDGPGSESIKVKKCGICFLVDEGLSHLPS